MAGLSENEKAFVKKFLKLFDDDDVSAIAHIVTHHMGNTKSRKACEDAIVLHSTSLDSFLKHKKVTKEKLFNYLTQQKIPAADKHKAALELQIKGLISGKSNMHTGLSKSLIRNDLDPHSNPRAFSLVRDNSSDLCCKSNSYSSFTSSRITSNPQPTAKLPPLANNYFPSPSSAQFNFAATSSARIVTEERVTTTTTYWKTETILSPPQPDPSTDIISKFAEWFYTQVNQSGGFRSEDFWPDVNINLMLKHNIETCKKAQGGTNSAILLNKISGKYKLYLKPNTSPQGIWGQGNEAGGLLQIFVCGTLHQCIPVPGCHGIQFGQCLGVFENLFLIACDMSINNWRIKKLDGILKSDPYMQQLPTIADSQLLNQLSKFSIM